MSIHMRILIVIIRIKRRMKKMRNLLQVTIKGDKEKNLKEIAQILGFKSLEDLKKETELAVENSETGDYWFISRLPDGTDDVRFSIFHIRNEGIQRTKNRDYVREIIRNIPTHE